MAVGPMLWGWDQAVKVTLKEQGQTHSIPGPCTRSGPRAVEIPWALLGFERGCRAGGVPQLGGNPATAPILWVSIVWERKSHLGSKFASI